MPLPHNRWSGTEISIVHIKNSAMVNPKNYKTFSEFFSIWGGTAVVEKAAHIVYR
jgi:hypothetical protein